MTEPLPDAVDSGQSAEGDNNLLIRGDVGGSVFNNPSSGTQNNDVVQLLGDSAGIRDLIIRDEIDAEHVKWLCERFAEPSGYDSAVALWTSTPVAYLKGAPKIGKRTAAVNLLVEAKKPTSDRITVIEPDVDTRLDLRRVRKGARVLLDLTDADAATTTVLEKQLRAFATTVDKAGGRLVVLLSGRETEEFRTDNSSRIRELSAPDTDLVLQKHLIADGFTEHEKQVRGDTKVVDLLANAQVSDAARLAALYRREATSSKKTGHSVAQWLDAAISAYHNWSDELILQYDEIDDAEHRSLLLTVALLNNSTTETLYWAERLLLTLAKCESKEEHLLAGRGFAGRLKKLKAVEFGRDRAWLTRHEYDLSVLKHVWASYPELRSVIVNWVVQLGAGHVSALGAPEREQMLIRFVDLCAENDAGYKVLEAVESWNKDRRNDSSPQSVYLLTMAALDERIQSVIHRKLYTWATKDSLAEPTADLVLRVCSGEFGRNHTEKALTRLGHLANHANPKISGQVVAAVIDLAVRDNVLPSVLAKTVEWLNGSNRPRQWEHARQILLFATAPENELIRSHDLTLPQNSELRVLIQNAWAAILDGTDEVAVQDAAMTWLSTAQSPEWRQSVLQVLVAAAGDSLERLSRLRKIARHTLPAGAFSWTGAEGTRDARHEVYDALTNQLDAVHPMNTISAEGPSLGAHGATRTS